MSIFLSDDELLALTGLPHSTVAIYILAVRQRMDWATGIVGDNPRISLRALAEWVYIEHNTGPQPEQLSVGQIRRSLTRLEQAGLLKNKTLTDRVTKQSQLRFSCPLAQLNKPSARSAPDPDSNHQTTVQPTTGTAVLSTPHVSSADHTDTNDDQPDHETWIWPNCITPNSRPALIPLLNRCQGKPQELLDELEGASQFKKVALPLRYLKALIKKSEQGEFVPEFGYSVASRRATTPPLQQKRGEAISFSSQGSTPINPNSRVGRAHARLMETLGHRPE